MSLKSIRNDIYGKQKMYMKEQKTVNEVMNEPLASDSEDDENVWEPSSMSIKDIKKVIKSMNEDPEQWKNENRKKSNENVSNYIDEISESLYKEQVAKDDKDVFE